MKVSGLQQLAKHYNRLITVELASELADGSQFAVRLRQVRPFVYFALGRSIPVISGKEKTEGLTPEQAVEWHKWKRDLVAQCLHEYRSVVQQNGSDDWQEVWEPVQVVQADPDTEKNQITIDDFDFLDNIDRCIIELMKDVNTGDIFDEFGDANFRSKGSDDDSVAGKKHKQQAT